MILVTGATGNVGGEVVSMRDALAGTSGIFLYPGYQDLTATLAQARRPASGRWCCCPAARRPAAT